jgi:hypothetical protein
MSPVSKSSAIVPARFAAEQFRLIAPRLYQISRMRRRDKDAINRRIMRLNSRRLVEAAAG